MASATLSAWRNVGARTVVPGFRRERETYSGLGGDELIQIPFRKPGKGLDKGPLSVTGFARATSPPIALVARKNQAAEAADEGSVRIA